MILRLTLVAMHPVDVVAKKDGRRIAIEVETGKSDSLYNIRKDLEAGFEEVIILCLNKDIKEKLALELSSAEPFKRNNIMLLETSDITN